MTTPLSPDDRLLRKVLEESEAGVEQFSTPHPDDETLALFAHAALLAGERATIVQHLSDCSPCRQTVSHLLKLAESDEGAQTIRSAPATWWTTGRISAMALAACLLLAVGLVIFRPSDDRQLAEARIYNQARELIEQGQFAQAQTALHGVDSDKVQSDRLRSLDAQAARRIPAAIALAHAGRLTQFGYDVNGTTTKGLEPLPISQGAGEAIELLKPAKQSDLEVVLNRGHALLSLGDSKLALAEFSTAVELDAKNPHARLGRGIAAFMADDFAAAEKDFREALALDPANTAAQINLALALAKQSRRDEAIAAWQKLLELPLADDDRALANRAVETLQKQLPRP